LNFHHAFSIKTIRTMKKIILYLTFLILLTPMLQAQQLVGNEILGTEADAKYGFDISMSADGTRVAVGAPESNAIGTESGQVRVYDFNGTDWEQVGNDINGEADYDFSGSSVSLSANGNRLVVGSPMNDGSLPGDDNYGHVRVFDLIGNTWTQVGTDIDGTTVQGRIAVDLVSSGDGNRIAFYWNKGNVEVYDLMGGDWIKVGQTIESEFGDC